jgi:hypothetical protein
MKAKEVQPFASFREVNDPGLHRLGRKAQPGEDRRQRIQRADNLPAVLAHHDEIVGVAHQDPVARVLPSPVEPVQVDVGQQRRDHAALRSPDVTTPHDAVLHHPGAQHAANQDQEFAVDDPLLDDRHQPIVRDRLKARGDVRLDHPPLAPPRLINEDLEGVVRRAPGPKPERTRQEVRLEDRLEHDPRRGLHDTIANRRDRQRPPLTAAGLRNEDPASRERTVAAVTEVRGQFVEHPG